MIKSIIKKFIKLVLTLIIFGLTFSFSYAIYESIHTSVNINNFKKRGVHLSNYDHEITSGDITIIRQFYSVSRETYYEKDGRNVINNLDDIIYTKQIPKLGYKGDIYVTRQSPFPNIPIAHQLMTLYYGGHAAIYDGDGSVIEAFGFPDSPLDIINFILHNPDDENPYYGIGVGKQSNSYWVQTTNSSTKSSFNAYYDRYYKSDFQILRVKQNNKPINDEIIDEVIDYANDLANKRYIYNFLFFLDMDRKYYCTDLISRAYDYVLSGTDENHYAKSLNDDGFITSVNDLILSKETYIALHFEVNKLDENTLVEKYYYLEQI